MKFSLITALALILICVVSAFAQVQEFTPKGFSFVDSVTVPLSADSTFDVMTGNVLGWWDHHMSDNPKSLVIEPKAGGGFYEFFDEAGHGVKHAEVIYAERGKKLRLEGPLGLAGSALLLVSTWDYQPAAKGTTVLLTVNMSGQIDGETAAIVQKVWHHFLYDGLKTYIESGKYREKFRP